MNDLCELPSKFVWGSVLDLPSSRSLRTTTHVIGGRYPCRSVAYVPRILLNTAMEENGTPLTVLDPFMGSGTTAVESLALGCQPFGLEVDPFARLISDVSTFNYSELQLAEIDEAYALICNRFKDIKGNQKLLPSTTNIQYWFEKENLLDLLKLKTIILEQVESNTSKRFLLVVMADIIRACSKAERQSLKPYISKRFSKKRADVLTTFKKAFSIYRSSIEDKWIKGTPRGINWLEGDATKFRSEKSIDIAITSPPYINAMDYVRCIKLESSWIDTGDDYIFRSVRELQLGESVRAKQVELDDSTLSLSKPFIEYLKEVDPSRYRTVLAYFQDMLDNIRCVYAALKPNGQYHIIVGNSVIRGEEIPTHEVLGELARSVGFTWDGYFTYPIKDHRTSLPRQNKGGKILNEHVISLRKLSYA